MKKLFLSLTLVSALTISLGSAAFAQAQQEPAPAAVETVHGNAPAQMDAAQAMTPATHALVLCMLENNLTYQPEDSQFFWTSLYYMLGLYGEMDERAELTDDTLILPSEVVHDYAAALYPSVVDLPQIPAPISERISYHAADDTYHLARGDEGLAEFVVQQSLPLGNGMQQLSGVLRSLEDGSTLVQFQATLSPHEGMFGYIITDLTLSA